LAWGLFAPEEKRSEEKQHEKSDNIVDSVINEKRKETLITFFHEKTKLICQTIQ